MVDITWGSLDSKNRSRLKKETWGTAVFKKQQQEDKSVIETKKRRVVLQKLRKRKRPTGYNPTEAE